MQVADMLALVTGGGGFLGTGIVRALLEGGARVSTFQRRHYDHLEALGVRQISGDIRDKHDVAAAIQGHNIVFHVAAKAGIWGKSSEYYDTNVTGTVNVIAGCYRHGVRRIVYTSSPSVVSREGDLESVDESAPYPDSYLADYPDTKARAERMILEANDSDTILTVSLRPHLIWGPGDNHLVPRIVNKARRKKLRLVGDGENLVDSVYIDNAVAAHIQAAERLEPGSEILGQAYFITNDEPLPMRSLLNRILQAAGLPDVRRSISYEKAFEIGTKLEKLYRRLRLRWEPPMTRFLAHQLATSHTFDIGAARRDLDYEPKVSIEAGMKKLADWIQKSKGG